MWNQKKPLKAHFSCFLWAFKVLISGFQGAESVKWFVEFTGFMPISLLVSLCAVLSWSCDWLQKHSKTKNKKNSNTLQTCGACGQKCVLWAIPVVKLGVTSFRYAQFVHRFVHSRRALFDEVDCPQIHRFCFWFCFWLFIILKAKKSKNTMSSLSLTSFKYLNTQKC